MGELSELTGTIRALKNVKEVELMGMPKLKKCVLMGGLKNVKSVKMENAGKLESVKGLKEVMEAEKKATEEKKAKEMSAFARQTAEIRNIEDLKTVSCYIGVIVVPSNCCNDSELQTLDLGLFVNLRELDVGDECFENVNEVKLIDSPKLERVVIGRNCFTKCKNAYPKAMNPKGHFCLKNCPQIRELKMGSGSFNEYAVCEIENVPSLKVMEMGDLNEKSGNFYYASLELKSDSQRVK